MTPGHCRLNKYRGFDWDRVSVLHGISYGVVFWIWNENNVDLDSVKNITIRWIKLLELKWLS